VAKSKTAQRGRQPGGGKSGQHGRTAQRARAIEAREQAEATERRRRLRSGLIFGTILVLALGAIGGGVAWSLGKDDRKLPVAVVADGVQAPPWTPPTDPSASIAQAGLRSAQGETLGGTHVHSHLDIVANGKKVDLPALIGIGSGPTGQLIAELHTHSPDGIIHVEAPDRTRRYVLGQLFTELGVKLDATHLGSFTAGDGKTLVGYVDGKKVDGDPARIELKNHRQIALIFGTADQQQNPPATFDFKKAGV
jgi:hypothetical protein